MLEHVYSEVGQPENDYSEPLDSLGRLYTSPPGGETQRRSEVEELRWKLRRERFSEGSLGSFRQKENTSEGEVRGKRKLSLGQFVRKLSRGSLMGEGRGDVVRAGGGGGGGGERLSKLVSRLVGAGRLASQQVWLVNKKFLCMNCHDIDRHPGGFLVLGVPERRRLLDQFDPHLHSQERLHPCAQDLHDKFKPNQEGEQEELPLDRGGVKRKERGKLEQEAWGEQRQCV